MGRPTHSSRHTTSGRFTDHGKGGDDVSTGNGSHPGRRLEEEEEERAALPWQRSGERGMGWGLGGGSTAPHLSPVEPRHI